jgi:hypothetical protein
VSKDEMRAKKIPSPNMADSLMMSFMVRDKKKPKHDFTKSAASGARAL